MEDGPEAGYAQGAVEASVALRPLFRRELRRQPDVFRNRYLTFRTGYHYNASTNNGRTSHENLILVKSTARYSLPLGIVLKDRNRGDFRFVQGRPFSARYRNRLWVEHDVILGESSRHSLCV